MSQDYIVRATAADHQLRVFAVTSRDLVEEARKIHNTSPVATAALGRLLTAGSMMGSMMKGDNDVLTLQIQCGGPIGGLTVTADSKANVKGYVKQPAVILPPNEKGKLDVSGAIGPGFLNVIRDIGMKEPYNGQTHLVSGEIAEDLTYYYATSEQVPSSVGLAEQGKSCAAGRRVHYTGNAICRRFRDRCGRRFRKAYSFGDRSVRTGYDAGGYDTAYYGKSGCRNTGSDSDTVSL